MLAHYKCVKPWCELVLGDSMPVAFSGSTEGLSLLFPMERLFQDHVASVLERSLAPSATIERQKSSANLCEHRGRGFLNLRPDLWVEHGSLRWVLDTKWKRLDVRAQTDAASGTGYGMAASDLYQVFAYGRKYMERGGVCVLIYPKTAAFPAPLPPFRMDDGLTLEVVPFDLDAGALDPLSTCPLPMAERSESTIAQAS